MADPSGILDTSFGFLRSKLLMAGVEFNLFSYLSSGPKSGPEIQKALGLHHRSLYDFLDSLTSLGFIQRTGLLESAQYSNSVESDTFLVKDKPNYLGGFINMANHRLYQYFGRLETGLKTGQPQNEIRDGEPNLFDVLYADNAKLEEFLHAMKSIQTISFAGLAEKFPFSRYQTLCDAGGADGALSLAVAQRHPHIKCISLDLPQVEPITRLFVQSMDLSDRVEVRSGDFFKSIPSVDIITFGNILHDWNEEEKLLLLKNAYDSLTDNGVVIIIELLIDDDRRKNAFSLLTSLLMLIETPGGFNFSMKDFDGWAKKVGFKKTELIPLQGLSSALVSYKNFP